MDSFAKFLETYSNSQTDGFEAMTFGSDHAPVQPETTFNIPTKSFTTTIRRIAYNQTPIVIEFENGQTWRLKPKQWSYLKSKGQEPKQGSTVDIEMTPDGIVKGISLRSNYSPVSSNQQSLRSGSSRHKLPPHGKLPSYPPTAF